MTKTTTCVYHFLVLNWYIFLNYYIPHIGKDEEKLKEFHDGGRSKYLTLLNLVLQAVFFGVACLDDVLKRIVGRKDIKFITSFRDLLFTTLAFPISTFVFLVFWTLFHYDRSLVYPEGLDDFFPAWVNHAMHTSILPFSLVEAILRPHHYPSKKLGLALLGTCNIAYIIRILWRYSQTGNWVYPVFAYLSPLGIIIFFSAAYILNAGIYLLGEKINHWKWGATVKPWMKKK
ncbi:androgen-dependent TFPI-regulating protein [Peromyscus maniculatus bairdii]|uniref:Androgen dependent TFPI regulating protein n=1 Tax=Peromyscus maniculatus bairdii TaxID=230844 RepID=A0A6I9L460_PERMB|nr:androgen-dependent TFPI-regulating protein [Peromyscus maniculatus bairdii]XP_042134327.1 androgen-dependent TFPI-regulating protein [Peromyscus maniculatus bairdii]XP_042134328.1 androgen-dependent TFPI-regulating protein [Peromyscus maniculatus bairdii]